MATRRSTTCPPSSCFFLLFVCSPFFSRVCFCSGRLFPFVFCFVLFLALLRCLFLFASVLWLPLFAAGFLCLRLPLYPPADLSAYFGRHYILTGPGSRFVNLRSPTSGRPPSPLRHDHSFWLRLSFVVLFAQRQMDGCRCDMSYYASYRPCKSLLEDESRHNSIV